MTKKELRDAPAQFLSDIKPYVDAGDSATVLDSKRAAFYARALRFAVARLRIFDKSFEEN